MKLVTRLTLPGAKLPERGHDIDVGLDVFCPTNGILYPGPNKIDLGVSIDVPIGYSAEIRPRTGMASGEKTMDLVIHNPRKHPNDPDDIKVSDKYPRGVALLAQSPPIDPGYTGNINAIVINLSDDIIEYPAHTRFGQLVVYPVTYAVPAESVDTTRGAQGFGSTGA
ncbi:Deoxyuridine 5'-triphosphate nucleotidohydrolase [compost metagenome]